MGKINLAFILSLIMIAVGCRSEYEFVETNTELKIISPLNSSNRPIDGVSKLVPSNN